MKIAIDVSPLTGDHSTQHKVRGTGFYVEHLQNSLKKYHLENSYHYVNKAAALPNGIDILHIPYFEPFFLTLPFHSSCKTIVTVHDLIPLVFSDHFPAGIKGNIKWQIQKRLLQRVDAVITDSAVSKKDIMKYTNIPESKLHVVYLAAGEEFVEKKLTEKEKQIILQRYNIPEKFLLYVGDATWNKNLPRLLEASIKVQIPLVLVGKTLKQEVFNRRNSWNADLVLVQKISTENKNIYQLGFVPSEDLIALYNMASAFVMPSLYEGFGLPILEAMQSGCPVITTREGSLHEVAKEAAYYVDAYNTDSIAKGMSKLATDKALQSTLSSAGKKQAAKFSWKKTADETVKVYEKVY